MRWTNEMDRCLSKILVEQVKLGNKNKLQNKVKPAAYVAAVFALSERFQLDSSKDHVKKRLKTWKKMYGKGYIKINPDARLLQGRVVKNYDALCVIIGDDDPTCSLNGAEVDLDLTADNEGLDTEDAFQCCAYFVTP